MTCELAMVLEFTMIRERNEGRASGVGQDYSLRA
jgi:hypothetical protein